MKGRRGQVLAYCNRANPRPIPRPINWKRFWVGLAAVTFLSYLVLAVAAPWRSWTTSVCTQCGIWEHTKDDFLPFTSVPFRHSRTQVATPLSTVIGKRGLYTAHRHQFVAAYYTERTWFTRACGGKRIDTVHIAPFIDQVAKYSDAATANKWISIVLNPNRDRRWDCELWIPPSAFVDRQSFQSWCNLHKRTLDRISQP